MHLRLGASVSARRWPSVGFMVGIDAFRAEVEREDHARLDRLVLALGAVFDPCADVDAELRRLDRVATQFDGNTPRELLLWMRNVGFRGNGDDYYNPDNSMLHRVLRSGLGIPITLSVVAMEIGRRRGMHLVGIGAPGEFLVREVASNALLNPFRHSLVDEVVLGELLAQQATTLDVAGGELLPVVTPLQIIERMLNNLEVIYSRRANLVGLERVFRLRSALPSSTSAVRRRHAAILEEIGGIGEGLAQIQRVIDHRDPSEDVLAVRKDWLLLRRLEAHLN